MDGKLLASSQVPHVDTILLSGQGHFDPENYSLGRNKLLDLATLE